MPSPGSKDSSRQTCTAGIRAGKPCQAQAELQPVLLSQERPMRSMLTVNLLAVSDGNG